MKTIAFASFMLSLACLAMGIVVISLYHDYRPFAHSVGSTILAFMMYSTISDKGDPDVKA